MSDEQRVGSAGRGALLMQAFLSHRQTQGSDDSSSTSSATVGSGRATLLSQYSREIENPPMGRGRVRPQTAQSMESGGRGRAALMELPDPGPQETQHSSRSSVTNGSTSTKTSSRKAPEHASVSEAMSQLTMKDRVPIARHGDKGTSVPLTANYVKLLLEPGKGVYEYEVKFAPEVDSRDMRFRLLGKMQEIIGKTKTFDGRTLYLPFKLKDKSTFFQTVHPVSNEKQEIELQFKKNLKLGECIHLYNVLFKRIMSALNFARIGRHNFDPLASKVIPHLKLEVWPGYITTVDEVEGGILLCCESTSRVLRNETILELMHTAIQRHGSNGTAWQEEIKQLTIGAIVLTRYNNHLYRVDDIDFQMTPYSTFELHSGESISFFEYYQRHYGITIRETEQPLLQSRMKKKQRGTEDIEQLIILVPELCFMTGLTDEMRSDMRVMKDIATYTRISPHVRQLALKKYLNAVNTNEKARNILKDWGLEVCSDSVDLEGRILNMEKVILGNQECTPSQNADWNSHITRNKVFSAVDLKYWALLYTQSDQRYAEDFKSLYIRLAPSMGMHVAEPRMVRLQDDNILAYLTGIQQVVKNSEIQIVVAIFRSARSDRYSAVKKLCCNDFGIPSQVINSKTLSKKDTRPIVQKIALQINCKIGGSLWTVPNPYTKSSVMVIGIDTYHDSVNKSRSVGGFVASLNPTLTKWYSRVCIQGPKQELIDGLKACFVSCLEYYFQKNGKWPDRIIVYRDGVGDGQLQYVLGYEVDQFISTFKNISPTYEPKFTVVVVQKRINTRLYSNYRGEVDNPAPGTVVDHTIVRKYLYDFFLVSQKVRQGTVSPTHYVVLYDNSDMMPNQIQQFSYKMCFMYFNWPGTIRVPAPCQYAHKLAQLVGMYTKQEHHSALAARLFYL